jgi:hypothetical protein
MLTVLEPFLLHEVHILNNVVIYLMQYSSLIFTALLRSVVKQLWNLVPL